MTIQEYALLGVVAAGVAATLGVWFFIATNWDLKKGEFRFFLAILVVVAAIVGLVLLR